MQTSLASDLATLQPASLDAGLIFSGKPSGRLIQGYGAPTAYTPTSDPDYIFHESSRDIIVWLMNAADPLYVFGPVGCGKTSSLKQLAARLNYPVFEVTGHGRLEFADLVGHLAVKDGNMVFEYGPLRNKLVDFAHEVRKLFMGEHDNNTMSGAIEVTLSTRTLLRWADLTVRFQPLAHQGIQPVSYALDLQG